MPQLTMPRHLKPGRHQLDSQNSPSNGELYLKCNAPTRVNGSLHMTISQSTYRPSCADSDRKGFKFYILRRLAKIDEYWTCNSRSGEKLLANPNSLQSRTVLGRTGSSLLPGVGPKRILRVLKAPIINLLPTINATPAHHMTGYDTQSRGGPHNARKGRPTENLLYVPLIQSFQSAAGQQKSVPLSFQFR